MRSLRTISLIGFLALSVFLLAACGSSNTSGQSSVAPTATATSSSSQSSSSSYGYSSPTPTAASSSSTTIVKAASATVNGKSETILTNAQGMTLYYFTSDTQTTTACGSGCTGTWPPLIASGSNTSIHVANVSGKFTTPSDANGQQVQYNGHFLYTYAGDSAAGQTNGEGIGGKWFVATPGLS